MLELGGVSRVDRDHAAVDVQLADNGAAALQLGPERVGRALSESQETDQDVLLRVFVREERLPTGVSHVVASDQFSLVLTQMNMASM